MISEPPKHAKDYLSHVLQTGRYVFTSHDAREALGVSPAAVKQALNRLQHKGEVASPAKGFYVIVPPEYRTLECLPADQFVPALMRHLRISYYCGLQSAAQYHGAAHHRPQAFQVMLEKARRPIHCGKVRVAFHVRKRLSEMPVQHINTPRGTIAVSTPAVTAFDLVGYESKIGGLDAVATILVELAEKLDPKKLAELAPLMPMPWIQRLGYLLEFIGEVPKAVLLKRYVQTNAKEVAVLEPSTSRSDHPRDDAWRLIINADLETET
jgi:predicted transcriptional regulator of viral defense system